MHDRTDCVKDIRSQLYVGKGWKARFACPVCGKVTGYYALNFLGSHRHPACDGLVMRVRTEED